MNLRVFIAVFICVFSLLFSVYAANEEYILRIAPAKHVSAVYEFAAEFPDMQIDRWVLFYPVPPETPAQKILATEVSPQSTTEIEKSNLKRQFFRISSKDQQNKIEFVIKVQAELFSRKLEAKKADDEQKTDDLSAKERETFLRPSAMLDFDNEMFTPATKRSENESEIAYAKRVFRELARTFSYEYVKNMNRKATFVQTAKKSDCGGLSILFVSILRSQGIPARVLAGRWAHSSNEETVNGMKYYQEHVISEFYAQGIGWVPADLASAILHDDSEEKLTFFGNDSGDFLTFHIDTDVQIDSGGVFGVHTFDMHQRPSFWLFGKGDSSNVVETEKWRAE